MKLAAAAVGDSGGPLFSVTNPQQPVQVRACNLLQSTRSFKLALPLFCVAQVGIASFVAGGGGDPPAKYCTRKDIPQVYVRLTSFKDMINSVAKNAQWC